MLTRLLVTPNIMGDIVDSPMSGDSIVWKEFIVKEINWRDVIKYEWMYWNITSDTEYGSWDTIRVRSLDDNLVVVEKISG